MKLSVIIPSIWRIERASALFETVLRDMQRGDELLVATDREGYKAFKKRFKTRKFKCYISEKVGYWRVMNESLDRMKHKTFLWTADDINPHEGWMDIARSAFEAHFPEGLGIVSMNDLIVGDATCGHAISTRNFLYVMFGKPYFPEEFRHLFLDTMIADRAKTLKRFYYAYNAIAEHMHYSVGKSVKDALNHRNEGHNDKGVKDAMDQQWIHGEWQAAKARLHEFGENLPDIQAENVPMEFRAQPVFIPKFSTQQPGTKRHVQSVGQSKQSRGRKR